MAESGRRTASRGGIEKAAGRCLSTNGSGDDHDATSNDGRADSHAGSRNHNGGRRGGRNRDDDSRGNKPRLG